MDTNSLLDLSVAQLKRAAELKEQIESLNSEPAGVLSGGVYVGNGMKAASKAADGKRTMSTAGRAKIAAAARARWAKVRAAKGERSKSEASATPKKKRTMSAAARAKIAAAQRARWAKRKAGK